MHLPEQRANDVRGAPARANLTRCRVKVALAGIPKGATGRKVERVGHPVRAAMAVLEHVCRDDEPPPREQALRRRKSFAAQAQGDGSARLSEQSRQSLRRQPLVCASDREQYRIHGHRINAVEGPAHEASQASGFRALDQGEERAGRVVLARDHQPVDSSSSRIEEIVATLGCHGDVRDERQSWQPLFELPHSLEIRRLVPVQVHHCDAHRLAVAQANKRHPVGTLVQFMPVANRAAQTLNMHWLREQYRDDAHVSCERDRLTSSCFRTLRSIPRHKQGGRYNKVTFRAWNVIVPHPDRHTVLYRAGPGGSMARPNHSATARRRMTNALRPTKRPHPGFTLVEIIIVLVMMAVIAGMAIPRLNLSQYRADAAAQQVRSVFQTAQRTSLTRQFDVIVSIDTVQFGLRIAEDSSNDGIIQLTEWKFWRPTGEGNQFAIPPKGLNSPSVASSVVGAQIRIIDGMKSVIFHRDGSTSTDAEIYVQSTYKGRTDYRAISVTRATGRTELFRLAGTGAAATWMVVQ